MVYFSFRSYVSCDQSNTMCGIFVYISDGPISNIILHFFPRYPNGYTFVWLLSYHTLYKHEQTRKARSIARVTIRLDIIKV